MTTVHHQLSIDAPPGRVYEAIATPEQIGTWWDKQTARETERGLVLEHDPGPEHGVVQLRVVQMIPNRRVEWECISEHPQSSPASAWTGTHFIFELAGDVEGGAPRQGKGQSTMLDFYQTGYDEGSEFFGFNKAAWEGVLQNLKRVVEAASD